MILSIECHHEDFHGHQLFLEQCENEHERLFDLQLPHHKTKLSSWSKKNDCKNGGRGDHS